MAHTRAITTDEPLDTQVAGFGARNITDMDVDLKERMELDHYWDSSQDTTLGIADGYHKKCTMYKSAVHPAGGLLNTGILHTYDDGSGVIELWYQDSAGNNVQITQGGLLKSRPCCSVYLNTDQIVGAGLTTVRFNIEDYDVAAEYNPATYKFTAANDGYYSISSDVMVYNDYSGGGVDRGIAIYKNGVLFKYVRNREEHVYTMVQITQNMVLLAGDFIEIRAHGGGAGSTLEATSFLRACTLNISKIG